MSLPCSQSCLRSGGLSEQVKIEDADATEQVWEGQSWTEGSLSLYLGAQSAVLFQTFMTQVSVGNWEDTTNFPATLYLNQAPPRAAGNLLIIADMYLAVSKSCKFPSCWKTFGVPRQLVLFQLLLMWTLRVGNYQYVLRRRLLSDNRQSQQKYEEPLIK